jgi:hypothetical protein
MRMNTTDPNLKPARAGRIRALQEQIDDLKKRLPAHSIPAAMLLRLEELEEELEREQASNDQQTN